MSNTISSRGLVGCVAGIAALLLAGCGEKAAAPATAPGAKPLTKIILQTDWYAQPEHGGFYQALVKGYYRDAGLDVTIEQGGPNSMPGQKLAMGSIQFSIGRSDELWVLSARGIPLVMVGALMQHDPQAIIFHKESGIHGFQDLDGHTIMAVPGSAWITFTERKYHIKISVTPLDFGLSRFMADKNFVQQCFITNEPYYVRQHGVDPGVLLLSETGFSPYRVWYTSRDFINKNPEAVRAFTAASIRGWTEYINGDRKDADVLIRSLNKQITPEFADYCVAVLKAKLVAGDPAKGEAVGRIDPARLAEEVRQLSELGMLSPAPKLTDVFDDRFLPDDVRVKPGAP
jgi:NitT/TauT family transport system substrate-binding protein